MLSERHSEREESANGNSARRPERVTNDMFENNAESVYLNNAEARLGVSTSQDQNSAGVNSNAEINKLSGEFNSRLSREIDDMMNSGNSQIQRAVSDAISNQKMPQIQNALKARSGHLTQNRWNVPAERPELNSEDCRSERIKGNLRSEPVRTCFVENHHEQAYDIVTGENEPPILVREFLTGRIPSRSHHNQPDDEPNPLLDTTIPAQERTAPAAEADPINRLADILTSMQNRLTAQQLTIRPVNSSILTFDGKSEKFELFEDRFHTMIKMQPEMSEQMKINHFHFF